MRGSGWVSQEIKPCLSVDCFGNLLLRKICWLVCCWLLQRANIPSALLLHHRWPERFFLFVYIIVFECVVIFFFTKCRQVSRGWIGKFPGSDSNPWTLRFYFWETILKNSFLLCGKHRPALWVQDLKPIIIFSDFSLCGIMGSLANRLHYLRCLKWLLLAESQSSKIDFQSYKGQWESLKTIQWSILKERQKVFNKVTYWLIKLLCSAVFVDWSVLNDPIIWWK